MATPRVASAVLPSAAINNRRSRLTKKMPRKFLESGHAALNAYPENNSRKSEQDHSVAIE